MQWFKKHPDFLRDESTRLSNDSNYKERHQCRDNLFISHGDILVRLDKVYRYPVLIVYLDATPFVLPAVFPLQRSLTKEEVDALAAMDMPRLYEKIKPDVHFYYQLRHQNGSGEICLLERENLEQGNNVYGITTILKRLRDWHAGHTTGNYPPDSEEVDYCSHFNAINDDTKYVYNETFLSLDLIQGDCYAVLYKDLHRNNYISFSRRIYLGTFIDGIRNSGLIDATNINLQKHFYDERIQTSLDLINKPAVVNELIKSNRLLKAQWFHIEKEPAPFQTFSELVAIIGNGDTNKGTDRLFTSCQETFNNIQDFFYLALRFPNKKGLLEFQLFKVCRLEQPPEYVIQLDARDRVIEMVKQYGRVEAIRCEKLTEETYHQRNSKRADYDILKNQAVNIFGVGAIGGEAADCMAKAGIGYISLVDDQRLSAHNAIRHIAGIDMTDEFKVFAVAELLRQHNHYITVHPLPFNLFNFEYNYLPDLSVSISTVADDYVELFVNEQMVIANRVVFYARTLRGGKVARIFRVIPGKDACFYCLSLYRNDKKEFIDIPEDTDYPTLKNECNNPIRPASAADMKLVASLVSRMVIDHLQNGASESNHWIWTSEAIPSTSLVRANSMHNHFIAPHSGCPYCNNNQKKTLSIPAQVLASMQSLISQNPLIETGGVLAGYTDEEGNVVVTNASGPGPKAVQLATRFEKDVEFCQKFLDDLFISSSRKYVYVGEWHSHPSRDNSPSGLDIKSLSEISVEKNYLTDNPAMIILSNKGKPSCTFHPAGKTYYFTELNIKND